MKKNQEDETAVVHDESDADWADHFEFDLAVVGALDGFEGEIQVAPAEFTLYYDEELQAAVPDVPAFTSELENFLIRTAEELASGLLEVRQLAELIETNWKRYKTSLQLYNEFAQEEYEEAVDFDEIRSLLRWAAASRRQSGNAQSLSEAVENLALVAAAESGSGFAGSADRVEQLQRVLAQAGQPLNTAAITERMAARGFLDEVADERATVSAALSRAVRMGFVDRVTRGVYELPGASEMERVRGLAASRLAMSTDERRKKP